MIAGARLLFCYDGSSFNAIMYMQYSRKPMTGANPTLGQVPPLLVEYQFAAIATGVAGCSAALLQPTTVPSPYKRNRPKKQLKLSHLVTTN
jgi:hypothetical protein